MVAYGTMRRDVEVLQAYAAFSELHPAERDALTPREFAVEIRECIPLSTTSYPEFAVADRVWLGEPPHPEGFPRVDSDNPLWPPPPAPPPANLP